MYCKVWSKNLKRKDYSQVLGIDGRIILEWILGLKMWTGFIWIRIGTIGRLL